MIIRKTYKVLKYLKTASFNFIIQKFNKKITKTIFLGKNVKIGKNCQLIGSIQLKDNTNIGENSILKGEICIDTGTNLNKNVEVIGNIKIGKYCAIARNVTFQGRNHFIHRPSIQHSFYINFFGFRNELSTIENPIIVGNDVWIGTRAIILSGLKIGDGAIIGAGAIVKKDVEPFSIVAGVPAMHKKWRFPEHIRQQLLEIKWWNWDEQKIIRNEDFFNTDLTSTKIIDLKYLINK